jgi:hypothetical protein
MERRLLMRLIKLALELNIFVAEALLDVVESIAYR